MLDPHISFFSLGLGGGELVLALPTHPGAAWALRARLKAGEDALPNIPGWVWWPGVGEP
jgi:hypothetical protein